MAYKKGQDRHQRVLFPDCIDEYVEADAPVRLFDAFVDSLKMDELEFVRSTPAETGTPGYDPRDLLKLYIYGYFYQVRSSRKLARECKCNVEVMWLLGKLTPDFRTISDFRKDNKKAITNVYKEFNKFCMGLKLFSKSYISIEGAKELCRNTRGPVASICYQGLLRIKDTMGDIERSVSSYGSVQVANLEKGCSWITLFIAMAPSLGFLGTVIGMVMAFDQIQQAGDISPTIVASGMKVALLTTIFGIIVALILQVFYNYILSKIEHITSQMEESAISLMDIIAKYKDEN